MRSKNKIKETVCVCLTRMRACTYFIWVIWILNHHMYFAKISTSSHPHVWLLAWLCISVSWLAVWCQTLLLSDSSQVGARWAVYSVIHSLVTPPAPLCISLYFCIPARCEVCEVYFRSLIFKTYSLLIWNYPCLMISGIELSFHLSKWIALFALELWLSAAIKV